MRKEIFSPFAAQQSAMSHTFISFFISEVWLTIFRKQKTAHQVFELYLISSCSKSVPTSCNSLLQAPVRLFSRRSMGQSSNGSKNVNSAGRCVAHLVGDTAASDCDKTLT